MVTKFLGSSVYFTSDTHFGHSAILKLCERPWDNVEDHDKALINNWNSIVGIEDTVFHLGDFCFGNAQKWKQIREQLNGHIILILGNHDMRSMSQNIAALFDHVTQQMYVTIDEKRVYLNHFPFLTFAHGSPSIYSKDALAFQAFGHVHTRKNNTGYDAGQLQYLYPTQYDVGVDFNDYKPISWEELNNRIQYQIDNNCNLTHWYET